MDSEKWTNSFEIQKDRLPDYLLNSYRFVNDFSALLLCRINDLDFFNMGDFCYNFEFWIFSVVKNFFKSAIWKMLKTLILHSNNLKKLFTNCQKKNSFIK